MPTIWLLERTGFGADVSEATGTEETVFDAVLLGSGWLVSVMRLLVEDFVLVLMTTDEILELEVENVVGAGATRTILGIVVCMTSVAVIVACVFGKALG